MGSDTFQIQNELNVVSAYGRLHGAPPVPGYGAVGISLGHGRQHGERIIPACPQQVNCRLEFAFMFLGDLQLSFPPDTLTAPNRIA